MVFDEIISLSKKKKTIKISIDIFKVSEMHWELNHLSSFKINLRGTGISSLLDRCSWKQQIWVGRK